jgi:hypothetical protein
MAPELAGNPRSSHFVMSRVSDLFDQGVRMNDGPLDPEARSWNDAEAASAELPAQLRVLHRMVAAARARLEEISDRVTVTSAANDLDDRHPDVRDSPGPDRL